jgi:hypothetical protein
MSSALCSRRYRVFRLPVAAAPVVMFLLYSAFAGSDDKNSLSLNRVPANLKPYVNAVGDRLRKPGKERISAIGTLQSGLEDASQPIPVKILWQHPIKVRLDIDGGAFVIDGAAKKPRQSQSKQVEDTLEVLLEDSVEGLLAIEKGPGSTRLVGSGFKPDGATVGDSGVDIVQTIFPNVFRSGQPSAKTYWFSHKTKLLGQVVYYSGTGKLVEVVIQDWRDVQGEKIPFWVERWEDRKLTMRLILTSANVSTGAEDETFKGN